MTARRTTTILASAAVLAGALALTPTSAGGQAAGCAQPYAPLDFARTYPEGESIGGDIEASLVSIPFDRSQNPIDMDGDGTDDGQLVDPFDQDVQITRGDGVLDLSVGGADFAATDGLGDLDGDGRDELGVQVEGGSDPGSYVVPGTTPVGATTVAAAGIRVDGGEPLGVGDGSGRLLLVGGDTRIIDGPTVLAEGPGGDATGVPVLVTVPGEVSVRVPRGDADDLLLTVHQEADRTIVTVLGSDTVTLTTAPEPFKAAPDAGAEVLDGPDGVFVIASATDRSGTFTYLWSLTRPCGPLLAPVAPPTTTPTAPPAAPVDAEAAFTG